MCVCGFWVLRPMGYVPKQTHDTGIICPDFPVHNVRAWVRKHHRWVRYTRQWCRVVLVPGGSMRPSW